MEKLNIKQWAEEDRPREKMAAIGAENLTNAELLAILIGSGSKKESAVDLMKQLLADCNNNLNTPGKMTIRDLCLYNGIGEAKAITILAACELGAYGCRCGWLYLSLAVPLVSLPDDVCPVRRRQGW